MNRRLVCRMPILTTIILAGCFGDSSRTSQPLDHFGKAGRGPGEFSYPRAAVAAAGGLCFVVDKAGRIQCLTQQGEPVREWRMPEIYAGKPTGLGLHPDQKLYVADTHYARVMIYSFQGELLDQFGSWGDGRGMFRLPTDVAIDRNGFIYVSEYGGNDRVSKFTPDHEYVLSFGGPDSGRARLSRPQGVCCDPDGTLWVADASNHRICHFDADGVFLGAFGRLGSGPGELRFPYNVELLSDGTLVVCEYGNNRVQRFDRDGNSLGIWGEAGRSPGQLAYPWALTVLEHDRILVVDSGNNRMQIFAGGAKNSWRMPGD